MKGAANIPRKDLPLDQLYQYRGSNPKPEDYDTYWAKALDELDKTPLEWVLEEADFSCNYAKCYHLYYTGTKGAKIHAKYIRPNQVKEPGPAVLSFHGNTMNSGDFYDKLPYVAEGIAVATMDVRGQGGLSQDPGGVLGNTQRGHIIRGLEDDSEKLFYKDVFLDTVMLARILASFPEINSERMGAMGISQGAGLALICGSLYPKIKRVAVTNPFLCDYQRVWELDYATLSYEEIRNYFRIFDPLHQKETEMFLKLGYIDVQHMVERLTAKVNFATGLMDTNCPPSTQFAVYNKINGDKTMTIYPDYGHESLPKRSDAVFMFLKEL